MTPADLLEQLLIIRGYSDKDLRENFLHPKYQDLFDPYLMHDMEKAVSRLFLAFERKEKICIYSDYDADGIPGAVILHDLFKKIGYSNFCNYIPHRHDEGYGVHKASLEQLAGEGVTVGITAVDEIAFGNSLGLEIIITDHHEPLEILPDAYAIVNPKLGTYPDRMLCGSGVAFKLVQAMLHPRPTATPSERGGTIPVGWEKWLLDMAGLATLSDMVPLVNENRIIAYYGMKVLQKTPRPGLVALFQKSGINLNYLVEDDVVFSITPRLNAASRMAHPIDAFNTLAATDNRTAILAAEHLSKLNDERKKVVARIMKDVHKKVGARSTGGELKNILVIGDPAWPAGILGLIAGKVVEEYQITTFVWGSEGEVIKGSARGLGDISVVVLMQSAADLLVQFGGHEEAGGFTATRETIHLLEAAFEKNYHGTKHELSKQKKEITADLDLNLEDVTINH
jgi:single-stranded-DNA-specific exonuclease